MFFRSNSICRWCESCAAVWEQELVEEKEEKEELGRSGFFPSGHFLLCSCWERGTDELVVFNRVSSYVKPSGEIFHIRRNGNPVEYGEFRTKDSVEHRKNPSSRAKRGHEPPFSSFSSTVWEQGELGRSGSFLCAPFRCCTDLELLHSGDTRAGSFPNLHERLRFRGSWSWSTVVVVSEWKHTTRGAE